MKNENIQYRQAIYNKMDDPESGFLSWDHWGFEEIGDGMVFMPPYRHPYRWGVSSEAWTGKQDHRGKKVFEGDILRYPGTTSAIWVVKYNERHASIDLSPVNDLHRELLINEIGSMEVIGNVTENPDLLEDK